MQDYFEDTHVLLKNKMYSDVLDLVFDKKLNRIKKPYDIDLNHAWYIVGDIFFKAQKYDLAVSCFKKSLAFEPNDTDAMCALSNCYSEQFQPKKSALILRKALKIRPNNSKLLYNYANSLFDMKNYDEALKYYHKVSSEDVAILELALKNIIKCKKISR